MAAATVPLIVLLWQWDRSLQGDTREVMEDLTSPGPPWRYGYLDARFTLIEYADLEGPYCKAYSPVLKQWIDAHPDVNWQWHHLPLPMHEPAATRSARLADCAGEVGGRDAFWNAIDWVHSQTLGDGQGLSPSAQFPHASAALDECLASTRPDAVIRAQVDEATEAGVTATPMLRVIDNRTGRSLLLPGAVEGDALLSAIDLLISSNDSSVDESPDQSSFATSRVSDMPADSVSDMPR